jgi:hypothetical protein
MAEDPKPQWSIRSNLISVSDLDRSVVFYLEIGPFEAIARNDDIAVVGDLTPPPTVLILRESPKRHSVRHGQQSLGLRSITFNVGSRAEMDRVERVLQERMLPASRYDFAGRDLEVLRGRDPDNLPLIFVYPGAETRTNSAFKDPDYYLAIVHLAYSLDV